MKVTEIFYSIQGESTFSGLPCVFIRLSGCSLRCLYCDTRYAYEEGTDLTTEAILAKVETFQCPLVTVTGGEPLEAEGADELLESLVNNKYTVLLETNGTRPLQGIPKEVAIIMDIKCPSSGFSDKTVWENLNLLSPKDEIKFVIADEKDFHWAAVIVNKYNLTQKRPVLFSPAAPSMEPIHLSRLILQERLPVRLQLQLHKIIWGEETEGFEKS